ncbi:MAG: DUF3810 domain-containing protein [Eubacterium sp.]|nr:DUF3810 domain-containing protein [Eubacterium sp.]
MRNKSSSKRKSETESITGQEKNKSIVLKAEPICAAGVFLLVSCVHIAAWNSTVFSDWYRLHIFPAWTGVLGRISNLFSGSVGEILIVAGACLALLELIFLPVLLFCKTRGKLARLRAWNFRLICWVLLYIYGTETLNCYVLYHTQTLEEQAFQNSRHDGGQEAYGMQELVAAYTRVVTRANELSGTLKRDADGSAVYDGSMQQLYAACAKAMQAQGEAYPYLAGYYPDPKPIRASHFMSQQYLLGIYFPFTMEANYNTVMYPVNLPATVCHEYSHLKGVILEDEANFFGFAACIESEDPYLQYSGYLSVLGYLARQVRESVPDEVRKGLVQANEQVQKDDVFLTQEQWEQVEKKAVLSTETVNKATNVFLEKNLTMNGVEDGMKSYSRVVRLVILYYAQELQS